MKIVLLCIVMFSSYLYADKPLKKAGLEKIIQPKVSLKNAYLSDAKVSGSDGSVAVAKTQVSINNKIAGISYTNWAFDWQNVADLPFGDGSRNPITQMHSIRANINAPYFLNDKIFILTSLSLKSTFEKEIEGSYSGGLFSFASYKLDQNHAIQFGAFANYHPVSTLALPVISYSYRARQSDGFKFILGFPRTYVGYHVNENLLLRFGMVFSQSVIRLSNDSAIESSGFIEAEDYMSNLGFSYEFNQHFTLESDLLYSVKRNFIIYSKNGDSLSTDTIEPSFGMNFKLSYIF